MQHTKKIITLLLLWCITQQMHAQSNGVGIRSFRFLDITVPSRAMALGGSTLGFYGDDVNLIYSNPASVSPYVHNQLSVTYNNYIAGMNFGNVVYAYGLKDKSVVTGGLQFFNYGKFQGYDQYDEPTQKFSAADYALNISYTKPFADTAFSYGITLKTLYSYYYNTSAFANAIDLGINYHKQFFSASVIAVNVGKVWKSFNKSYPQTLPQRVDMAVSYKLPKAPFRLQLVYNDLLNWHLDYVSPLFDIQNNTLTGEGITVNDKKTFGFILVKHLILSNEIILSKNFFLRVGYNFRRAQEMRLPDARPANGLCLGFEIKVSKFRISYAYSKLAVGGNTHTFGMMVKLNELNTWFRKKENTDTLNMVPQN